MDFEAAKRHIIRILKHELSSNLTYHSLEHTIDVHDAAIKIAEAEQIPIEDVLLLKTAALLHDIGFTISNENHEENGCIVARKLLPKYGYDDRMIATICDMILSTRIPQNPSNKLEQILCDADLDYLGRSDFETIGQRLYKEWKHFGIVQNKTDWNRKQIEFLRNHRYFTDTSRSLKAAVKIKHLQNLKAQFA